MKFIKILFMVCILITGCDTVRSPDIPGGTQVTLVHDISDELLCTPEADPILAIYNFEYDKSQAGCFRHVIISDKKLNPTEEIRVEDGNASESGNKNQDIDYRNNVINAFYDSVRVTISNFHKQFLPVKPLDHSECFSTISSELQLLANSKALKKVLIVFSDLQENANVFSCYREKDKKLLEIHPENVGRLLLKYNPFPKNLSHITIVFVYNPGDRNHDMRFSKMIVVYKKLLEDRGAKVIVQASSKNFAI